MTKHLSERWCWSNTQILHILRELLFVGSALVVVFECSEESGVQLGLRVSVVGDGRNSLIMKTAATDGGAGRVLALVHGAPSRTSALRVRLNVVILNASLLQHKRIILASVHGCEVQMATVELDVLADSSET